MCNNSQTMVRTYAQVHLLSASREGGGYSDSLRDGRFGVRTPPPAKRVPGLLPGGKEGGVVLTIKLNLLKPSGNFTYHQV
jgi:hypothetical protein